MENTKARKPKKTATNNTEKREEKCEGVVRKSHKTVPSKVRPNNLMAIIHFVKVNRVENCGDSISVTSLDDGGPGNFEVRGRTLIENAFSADLYEEEVEVTKTRAAEILTESFNRPLTVNFDKQEGENRTLRGRFLAHEKLLGRSKVEDLDVQDGYRIRLVDHRTINWLIVDGVKYTVK